MIQTPSSAACYSMTLSATTATGQQQSQQNAHNIECRVSRTTDIEPTTGECVVYFVQLRFFIQTKSIKKLSFFNFLRHSNYIWLAFRAREQSSFTFVCFR